MKVELQVKAPGTHRVEYHHNWWSWALPLRIGIATSFFPRADSATTDLTTWAVQRVLYVGILCLRMDVVIQGPLFDDPEDDPA